MLKYFIEFFTLKEVYGTILTLVLGIIIYKIIYHSFEKIVVRGCDELERKKKKTIVHLLQNLFKYAYAIILLLIILQIFGINTKSFIAGLGLAGVVIGFALQDILKDIVSGISIIMDDYFVVGDLVEIKGFKGTVISLGLKTTKIENENGKVNILTNRTIDNVINFSKKSPKLKLFVTFSNNNSQNDIEQNLLVIIEDLKKLKYVKKITYLGIEEIIEDKVKYCLEANCLRGHENDIKRQFNTKIKQLYDSKKIKK